LHFTDIRNGNKTKFEILAEKLMELTDLNTFLRCGNGPNEHNTIK
jgi:hypothetical protein